MHQGQQYHHYIVLRYQTCRNGKEGAGTQMSSWTTSEEQKRLIEVGYPNLKKQFKIRN